MAIALGVQTPVAASINSYALATLNVASSSADITTVDNSAAVDSSVSTITFNPSGSVIANRGIQPEPVIRVTNEGELESPYIKITQNTAENNTIKEQPSTTTEPVDTSRRQLQSLNEQQDDIQARKELLADQEEAIQRQIDQLHQKELEINRKRFQLQQQSQLGRFVNLQI